MYALSQRLLLLTIAAIALGIDRVVKNMALQVEPIELLSWLRFEFHLNTAMALSLPLIPWVYFPLLLAVTVLLGWLTWQAWSQQALLPQLAFALIWAGAISNAYDRLVYGGVIDYVNVTFWSVFNLADCYIVGGVVLVLLLEVMQSNTVKTTNTTTK